MRIFFFFFFLFIAMHVQSQKMPSYADAPLNPIPEKYTTAHWQFAALTKKVIKISYKDTFVYHFARDGRLTSIESPYYTKPSVYVYDNKGKLLQNISYNKFDSTIINFTYNSQGQLTKTDYAGQQFTVNFFYNEKGLLSKETNTDGKEIKFTYDSKNRLILEEEKDYSNSFIYIKHPDYLEVNKTSTSKNYSSTILTYYDSCGNKIGVDNADRKEPVMQVKIERDAKANYLKGISIYTNKSKEDYSYEYY